MSGLLLYFVESGIGLGLFYLIYRIFLHKETFFALNRFFLLGAVALALLIPALHVPVVVKMDPAEAPAFEQTLLRTQMIKHSIDGLSAGRGLSGSMQEKASGPVNALLLAYLAGVILMLARLFNQVSRMLLTAAEADKERRGGFHVLKLKDQHPPFSFLHFIFLDHNTQSAGNFEKIWAHEKVHAGQLHSLDLIFLELAAVFLWFNPFIYWYKKALMEVHEYLADRGAISSGQDRIAYQEALLRQTVQRQKVVLASGYNLSLTKKRLNMITKKTSNKIARAKYAMILPVAALLALNFAIFVSAQYLESATSAEPAEPASEAAESSTELTLYPPVNSEDIVSTVSADAAATDDSGKKVVKSIMQIITKPGAPVLAAADGKVFKTGVDKEKGAFVAIMHDKNVLTTYLGFAKFKEKELKGGMSIKRGFVLGFMGDDEDGKLTHLTYEVIMDGQQVDPTAYFTGFEDLKQTSTFVEVKKPVVEPDVPPKIVGGHKAVQEYITANDLYPKKAKQAGKTGKVVMELVISEEGELLKIHVTKEKPADYGFADAAVKAIEMMEFKPGIKDGKPVTAEVVQVVKFLLE